MVLFFPAPQTAMTDGQLDGALRQLRQFMGEFLLQLTPGTGQGVAPSFYKSFYRMFRLMDNLTLMQLAADPKGLPYTPVTLDFAGLCRQLTAQVTPMLAESGISLTYHSQLSSLLITGDGPLLQRLLLELLANSAKSMGPGGEIQLRLRSQRGRVVLSLSDSASTPTSRQMAAMLQQDADQYLPLPEMGAGLGLALVRHIVALHQGAFLVECGQGAPTVMLSLPVGVVEPRVMVQTPVVQQDGGLSPLLVGLSDVLPAQLFAQAGLD